MQNDEIGKLLKIAENFLIKSQAGKGLDFDQVLSDFGLRIAKKGELPDRTGQDYWDHIGWIELQWTVRDYLRREKAVRRIHTVNDSEARLLEMVEEQEDKYYQELVGKLDEMLVNPKLKITDVQRASFRKRRYDLPRTKLDAEYVRAVLRKLRRNLPCTFGPTAEPPSPVPRDKNADE